MNDGSESRSRGTSKFTFFSKYSFALWFIFLKAIESGEVNLLSLQSSLMLIAQKAVESGEVNLLSSQSRVQKAVESGEVNLLSPQSSLMLKRSKCQEK